MFCFEQESESGIYVWVRGYFLVEGSVECTDVFLEWFYGSCALSECEYVWV